MPLDRLLGVRAGEVAVRDDPVREAEAVGPLLQPAGLLDWVGDPERGLHVHALAHVLEARLRDVVLRAIREHLQPVDVAEDGVDEIRLEPSVEEAGILQVDEVDLRVDQGQSRHVSRHLQHNDGAAGPRSRAQHSSGDRLATIHQRIAIRLSGINQVARRLLRTRDAFIRESR